MQLFFFVQLFFHTALFSCNSMKWVTLEQRCVQKIGSSVKMKIFKVRNKKSQVSTPIYFGTMRLCISYFWDFHFYRGCYCISPVTHDTSLTQIFCNSFFHVQLYWVRLLSIIFPLDWLLSNELPESPDLGRQREFQTAAHRHSCAKIYSRVSPLFETELIEFFV